MTSTEITTNRTRTSTTEENESTNWPLQQTPIIHNISPRTISGVLNQYNQNAIDWSLNGLIGFGCQNRVIIADTKNSIKVCQSTLLLLHGEDH